MDISDMLSIGENTNNKMTRGSGNTMPPTSAHHYPTRLSMPSTATTASDTIVYRRSEEASQQFYEEQAYQPQMSPSKSNSKGVTFELRFTGSSSTRARLPLRVNINSHDTVDSIVGTVKNFYGLYDAQSVSFEDQNGNVIIAQYENFENNMVVYVQVETASQYNTQSQWAQQSAPAQRFEQDGQMLPPQPAQVLSYGQPLPRIPPQAIRNQSLSPRFGTRSGSANQVRTRVGHKSRGSSFQAGLDELDHDANPSLSDSDCGAGSVTSSKKARSEQLASAEISVDNIVEGGRRVRAKFESSELPLFVPPQVPAPNSISSISPQRRSNGMENPSPFPRPQQKVFSYSIPLQSPKSFTFGEQAQTHFRTPSGSAQFAFPTNAHSHQLRDRHTIAAIPPRIPAQSARGSGILPTPDPTVASCISDEDVALQLMRLGDASNFSHGRTSASTFDDAFSGKADAASSATSDSGSDVTEMPQRDADGASRKRRHVDVEDDEEEEDEAHMETNSKNEEVGNIPDSQPQIQKVRSVAATNSKASRPSKQHAAKRQKASITDISAPQLAGFDTKSRKSSLASTINFHQQLGTDEDDLSTKPRCQRCRKSKKGCDRQRPCGRCKDAGIGIEGCISEDEGNGRKGRYGRHMGVSLKKGTPVAADDDEEMPTQQHIAVSDMPESKKRKR